MRDTLTSPRVEDMKRKLRAYHIRLSILLFILFISIVGALSYFSAHPKITIRNIVVTGTRIINPADIESLVQSDIVGRYLRLFKKSNGLIYPHKKIYNDLITQFPRIEKLAIYRDNFTTLHIDITERSGSYLYCGAIVPEAISDVGENCYFVNSDGYVFDKAPYFSGNVYFKYYIASKNIDLNKPLGAHILLPDDFHILARFIDGITSLGFKPIYVVIDNDGLGTLYLSHTVESTSPKIVFKSTDNLDTMLSNLSVSMGKKEFANEVNSKYTTLLYIDLRFNNKVVYKFQE